MQCLAVNSNSNAKFFYINLQAFQSRLAWRCHFVQKLEQQSEIETQCMHAAFESMRAPSIKSSAAVASSRTGALKSPRPRRSLVLICRISRNCSINKMRRRRFNSDSGTGRFLRCRLLFGRQGDVRQRCVLTRNPQVRGEVVLVYLCLQMACVLLLQSVNLIFLEIFYLGFANRHIRPMLFQ